MGLGLILSLLWIPGRRALLVKNKLHPIFTFFSDRSRKLCQLCVSNTQPAELVRSHAGFRARRLNHCALTTAPYQPTKKLRECVTIYFKLGSYKNSLNLSVYYLIGLEVRRNSCRLTERPSVIYLITLFILNYLISWTTSLIWLVREFAGICRNLNKLSKRSPTVQRANYYIYLKLSHLSQTTSFIWLI